ncbi:hypothetical protein [Roseibium sp. M-1]
MFALSFRLEEKILQLFGFGLVRPFDITFAFDVLAKSIRWNGQEKYNFIKGGKLNGPSDSVIFPQMEGRKGAVR